MPEDSRQLPRLRTAEWHLCYVDGDWAYFSEAPPTDVYGDDWNDAPHDCNAGEPYRQFETFKVAFDGDLEIVGVNDRDRWGYLSVDDINDGKAPWLVQVLYGKRPLDDNGHLPLGVQIDGGTPYAEFKDLVAETGGCVYEAVAPGA